MEFNFENASYSSTQMGDNATMCPSINDGTISWRATLAGEEDTQKCPNFIYGRDPTKYISKLCDINGTWINNEINLLDCRSSFYNLITLAMDLSHLVTFIATALAVFISLKLMNLESMKRKINLSVVFNCSCYSAATLMKQPFVVRKFDVLRENSNWCQSIHLFNTFSMMSSFMWSLCEWLIMYNAILKVFPTQQYRYRYFFCIGSIMPLIFTVAHVVYRKMYYTSTRCLISKSPADKFISIPILTAVILSFMILVGIIIHMMCDENKPHRATNPFNRGRFAYCTFKKFLGLLMKLPEMAYAFLPENPLFEMSWELVGYGIVIIMTAFQGLIASFSYCFNKREVKKKIKDIVRKKWNLRQQWIDINAGIAASKRNVAQYRAQELQLEESTV